MLQKVLVAVMLFGSLVATGCGGAPSAESICDEYCDKQASCNQWTSAQKSTCMTNCQDPTQNGSDTEQMAKDDCKNSDTVINASEHCYTSYCAAADINSCLTTATSKCEAK